MNEGVFPPKCLLFTCNRRPFPFSSSFFHILLSNPFRRPSFSNSLSAYNYASGFGALSSVPKALPFLEPSFIQLLSLLILREIYFSIQERSFRS